MCSTLKKKQPPKVNTLWASGSLSSSSATAWVQPSCSVSLSKLQLLRDGVFRGERAPALPTRGSPVCKGRKAVKLLHFSSFLISASDNDFPVTACRHQHTTVSMHRRAQIWVLNKKGFGSSTACLWNMYWQDKKKKNCSTWLVKHMLKILHHRPALNYSFLIPSALKSL